MYCSAGIIRIISVFEGIEGFEAAISDGDLILRSVA